MINMLDPIGKTFFGKVNELVEDKKFDFGYGVYAKRRREQAILVHHAVVWRLTEAAKQAKGSAKNSHSHVTTMRHS